MTEPADGFAARPRLPIVPLVIAFVGVLATAFWCFSWRAPLGVPNEWQVKFTYGNPWSLGAWLLPLGGMLILGGLAIISAYDRFRRAKSRREQQTSTRLAVFALTLLSLSWQWSLL